MLYLEYIGIILVSYFLGNFTFARFFANSIRKNITKEGSGNPGTMNMVRNHGIWFGILTLLFDALKCAVPCLIAKYALPWEAVGSFSAGQLANIGFYLAGLSCVLGHMWPVIFKFKGGKGVACGFGMIVAAHPLIALGLFVIFVLILVFFKIASLGSLLCTLLFYIIETVLLLKQSYWISWIILTIVVILIFYQHRKNIVRLFQNKENVLDLAEASKKDKETQETLKQINEEKKQALQNKKKEMQKNNEEKKSSSTTDSSNNK